jgi:hypothetical protein
MDQLDEIQEKLQQDLKFAHFSDYKGHCYKCHDPIRGLCVTFEEGLKTRTLHVECFKCDVCSKAFEKNEFIPFEQKKFCRSCFEARSPSCSACHLPLVAGDAFYQLNASTAYHKHCLKCNDCDAELTEVFKDDSHFFCQV